MPFSGTLTLLKTTCEEPCGNGGTGGGGGGGIDYQPQIDKINTHLNQNDGKITTLEVEQENIKNDIKTNYTSKVFVNNVKQTLEQQIDALYTNLNNEDKQIKQSIRNIENDLNNQYVTKLEQAEEVEKLNKRIDGIQGGGGGIDYQPQIDALKESDKQINQKILENTNKITSNTNEINGIKNDYVTKVKLAETQAEISKSSNDYTDAEIVKVNKRIDGLGTGGGSGGLNNNDYLVLALSYFDGRITANVFETTTRNVIPNDQISYDITWKASNFTGGNFILRNGTVNTNRWNYPDTANSIVFFNAVYIITWKGNRYSCGVKSCFMNNGDVDFLSGSDQYFLMKRL